MNEKLIIRTFGGFSISYKDKTITDQDNRSKKIWTLLEYIISFHDKAISQSALIDLLWTEDSVSVAPENALKTCLHRTRIILDELGFPEKKFIINKQGTYSWNNAINSDIDFLEFESLCSLAAQKHISSEERIVCYKKAFELYRGDYLPKCTSDDWAVPLITYYHTMYLKMVHELIALLDEQESYKEMTDFCCTAATIDAYDETIHYHLILSLYKTGKQQQAVEEYNRVINRYYNDFGINPPTLLNDLYKKITAHEKSFENDLNTIQNDLCETNAQKKAYFCDYTVFRHFYRIQARTCARNGISVYICLITLNKFKNKPVQGSLFDGMKRMKDIIETSLRNCDVFSQYSLNQYIIMLPTACYESSIQIGNRLLKNFSNSRPKIDINASFAVKHIEPQLFGINQEN